MAQPGSAPEWGSGGRRFESGRPDLQARSDEVAPGLSLWIRPDSAGSLRETATRRRRVRTAGSTRGARPPTAGCGLTPERGEDGQRPPQPNPAVPTGGPRVAKRLGAFAFLRRISKRPASVPRPFRSTAHVIRPSRLSGPERRSRSGSVSGTAEVDAAAYASTDTLCIMRTRREATSVSKVPQLSRGGRVELRARDLATVYGLRLTATVNDPSTPCPHPARQIG